MYSISLYKFNFLLAIYFWKPVYTNSNHKTVEFRVQNIRKLILISIWKCVLDRRLNKMRIRIPRNQDTSIWCCDDSLQCPIDANASRMHNCIWRTFNAAFCRNNLSVASSPDVYRRYVFDMYVLVFVHVHVQTTRSTYAVLRDRAEAPTSIALWQL